MLYKILRRTKSRVKRVVVGAGCIATGLGLVGLVYLLPYLIERKEDEEKEKS